MHRRAFMTRLAAGLALGGALGRIGPALLAAETTCPKCGAPREPGAAFCSACGHRFESAAAATAGPEPRVSVFKVVTAHDAEVTSTFASLVWESNLRIDSLLGSAFAVAPGEFITDSGLLVGAKEVSLIGESGHAIPAQVEGLDDMIGVALLKADLRDVPALPLRADEPVRAGEAVDALGWPSGGGAGGAIRSSGIVSGLHRGSARIHPIEDYLQTDASLPRGLAGGPMVDAAGRVVGMSTGFVLGSRVFMGPQSGIGYAVPAAWIARALAWIRAGAPARAWIGAYTVTVDPETRERHRLPPDVKLVVDQVFPGSPAAAAGLRRGDGLRRVGAEAAATLPAAQTLLLATHPGDSLPLEVVREGEALTLSATLAERPRRPRLAGLDALRFFGDLEVAPRDQDTLAVVHVASGSEAARHRVGTGDVLQSVLSKKDWEHGARDNSRWRSVRTPADLEERLATAYSDIDFCLGLRFKGKDGTRREIYLWEILTPTAAL